MSGFERDHGAWFRSWLMAARPQTGPLPSASLWLRLPHVVVTVEPTAKSVDEVAKAARKRLRQRRMSCEPVFPAGVAGHPDGRGMWFAPRRNKASRQLSLFSVIDGIEVTMSASEASAGFLEAAGPVQFSHPPQPGLLPLVTMPAVSGRDVIEELTLTQKSGRSGGIRLSAALGRSPVTGTAESFSAEILDQMRRADPGLAAGDPQPDTFLGGYPCVRRTLLRSSRSLQAPTRNEFWWAGVVNGRGVQVSAAGLTSIIELAPAAQLASLIRPVASG